jgi:hypothetical protein
MNKRLIIVVSLVVVLILVVALAYIVTRNLPGPVIYVDPQTTVIGPEQNFTIDVRISGVSDVYAWQFKLSWNNTLLDSPSLEEGTFLKNTSSTFFIPQTNATGGYVLADCTLLGPISGVNGSGVLARIQFHVSSNGSCSLHLYDATLENSQQQPTVPTLDDGHFSTT